MDIRSLFTEEILDIRSPLTYSIGKIAGFHYILLILLIPLERHFLSWLVEDLHLAIWYNKAIKRKWTREKFMGKSQDWMSICKQEIQRIHDAYGMKTHYILLWILTYILGKDGQNKQTAHRLRVLEQTNCRFLKDAFDFLDQKCIPSIQDAFDCVPVPQPFELENFYQEVLKGSYKDQTGSFYTGKEMAAFMVSQSLRDLLSNGEIGHTMEERLSYLRSIRIIDISCGGGMFLREGLKQLLALQRDMAEELQWEIDDSEWIGHILQNQLTGVDQEAEAAVLAEVLLRFETPQAIQDKIKVPIFCSDGLLWQPPCGQLYDLVIGNPPYIGEKGNQNIFKKAKETNFGRKYYERNMDYFYFFLYRGHELLKENGRICYITTSYFGTADGAQKLRQHLKTNVQFHWILQLGNKKVFHQAKGQHNLIYSLSKKAGNPRKSSTIVFAGTYEGKTNDLFSTLKQQGVEASVLGVRRVTYESSSDLFDERGQLLLRPPTIIKPALEKLINHSTYQLKDLCTVNQGLVSGADKVTEKHQKAYPDWQGNQGIFVLTSKEVEEIGFSEEEKKFLKPFHKNSDMMSFLPRKRQDQWILYVTDLNMPDIHDFPKIHDHLEKFRPILEKRREVQLGIRSWYALHWPRKQSLFEKPKIIAPQRCAYNIFAWAPEAWYASADVYYIQMKPEAWFSPFYLLGWLNSSLCYAYLDFYGKTKGKDLELYATPLKGIPIPMPDSFEQEESVVELVEMMMEEKEDNLREQYWNQLDSLFMERYGITGETAEMIRDRIMKLRRNLSRRNWR